MRQGRGFSTCGNALMPWGGKGWQSDEVEQPYVCKQRQIEQRCSLKLTRGFIRSQFEKLFVVTSDFYEKTADITASLKKLPAEDHSNLE